ncbi:MAG: adhesin [Methanosarcina spindle-shaped virus 1]
MRKLFLLSLLLLSLLLPAPASAATYNIPIQDASFEGQASSWAHVTTALSTSAAHTGTQSLFTNRAGPHAYQDTTSTYSHGYLTTSAYVQGIDGTWTVTYTFKNAQGGTLHTFSEKCISGGQSAFAHTTSTHWIPYLPTIASTTVTLTSVDGGTTSRYIDDVTATFAPVLYTVTVKNEETGAAIQNFNIIHQGNTYETTTGILEIPGDVRQHQDEYIQVSAPDCYSKNVLLSEPGAVSVTLTPSVLDYTFTAQNEETGASIQSFTVDFYTTEKHYSQSTTEGTLTLENIPKSAEISSAKLSAEGHYPRYFFPSNPTTAYLAANTSDVVLVRFSLIDYSNQFSALKTRLIVKKLTTDGPIVISDNFFDAAGINSVYLLSTNNYLLEIRSNSHTRGIGSYIPTGDETVSLVTGAIPLLPTSEAFGGFTCEITKTNTSALIAWSAPDTALVSPVTISITDNEGDEVYSLISETPQGQATYQFPDSRQYKISITAETTGGKYEHTEYITQGENLIDLQVSEIWYAMISVFLIFTLALCFGYRHASAGALIVALTTIGLSAVGFLHINPLVLALIAVLGVLAVLRGRGA